MTTFFVEQNDSNFAMDNFNLPKKYKKEWKTRLGWLYDFPWRDEQLSILKDFQGMWQKFVIQAVFGGGKTTMILAMMFDCYCIKSVNQTKFWFVPSMSQSRMKLKRKLNMQEKFYLEHLTRLFMKFVKKWNMKI